MIASRSLFSAHRLLLNSVNSRIKHHQQISLFQKYYSCCTLRFSTIVSLEGDKRAVSEMDQKKKRRAVWRPIATQATPVQGSGDGAQVLEMCTGVSSSNSNAEEVISISGTTTESTICFSLVEDNIEGGAEEGKPMHSANKHSISVEVGASLMRFVVGKGGSTQKQIEEEMGVRIIIPSSKKEESIIIEGTSVDGVTRASNKIQAILDTAVKSPSLDYSHFVSLPLAIHPELVDRLLNFQNSILGNSSASLDEKSESDSDIDISGNEDKGQELNKGDTISVKMEVEGDKHVRVDIASIPVVSYAPKPSKSASVSDLGIDKSIFTKPKTFHLTVLMLKLWNKERVNAASEVLKSISSKVMDALDNRPVSVRLKGLDCMRGSLAKAHVLYINVEEVANEGRLSRACQVIIDAFVEAGLVLKKDAEHKLKLHATVMNSRHRKGKWRTRKNASFDARGIFEQFGPEEWGDYLIREAHLSQRFVYDENGYYHCCASIPFPSMQVD